MLKVFHKKRSFKSEFKKQLRYAITASIGFTVAFAWRNAIFDTFQEVVSRALNVTPEHFLTQTYTAIIITIVAVAAIFATSKVLRD